MAIALTPFSALCGFLPLPQIATYVASTPEFASLIPATVISEFRGIANSRTPTGQHEKAVLRDLFSALMTAEEVKYKSELAKLVRRYNEGNEKDEEKSVKDLVIRLNQQFPGDIGVFCVFVLNYVKMEPGEAIFLGAGEPHAYVTGGKPVGLFNDVVQDAEYWHRHCRMYGNLRQCRARWPHSQIA